jgi:hypothetical protein
MKPLILCCLLFLQGCSIKYVEIPLEPYEASKDKATIFVYTIGDFDLTVLLDKDEVGIINADKYVRLEVVPGKHKIATGSSVLVLFLTGPLSIRREIDIDVEAGKVYKLMSYFRDGTFVSSTHTKLDRNVGRKYYILNDWLAPSNRGYKSVSESEGKEFFNNIF